MIRKATPADFDTMIALGRNMVAEGWPNVELDDAKVRAVLEALVVEGYAMVHTTDDVIDGLLLGSISAFWFSQALCAHDYAFYVAPAARGGYAAPRLVVDFIRWARAGAVAEIVIAVSSGVEIESSGRLLETCGFRRAGGVYKMKVA